MNYFLANSLAVPPSNSTVIRLIFAIVLASFLLTRTKIAVGVLLNYKQIKALVRRADCAKGEKRKRLVERLMRELPKLDPFEGFSEGAVWFAKLVARLKWVDVGKFN